MTAKVVDISVLMHEMEQEYLNDPAIYRAFKVMEHQPTSDATEIIVQLLRLQSNRIRDLTKKLIEAEMGRPIHVHGPIPE